nr:MAG TPA: hypothetical protein [Caudoviricetes sp.]
MTEYVSYGKITGESCTVLTIGGLLLIRGGDNMTMTELILVLNLVVDIIALLLKDSKK